MVSKKSFGYNSKTLFLDFEKGTYRISFNKRPRRLLIFETVGTVLIRGRR